MSRKEINPEKFLGALLLEVTSDLMAVRAKLARYNDIADFTRAGADFAPLAAALGLTGPTAATDAETLYSRYVSIETTMLGVDFVNLAEVDQGG